MKNDGERLQRKVTEKCEEVTVSSYCDIRTKRSVFCNLLATASTLLLWHTSALFFNAFTGTSTLLQWLYWTFTYFMGQSTYTDHMYIPKHTHTEYITVASWLLSLAHYTNHNATNESTYKDHMYITKHTYTKYIILACGEEPGYEAK